MALHRSEDRVTYLSTWRGFHLNELHGLAVLPPEGGQFLFAVASVVSMYEIRGHSGHRDGLGYIQL